MDLPLYLYIYIYSYPQIDGKVNPYKFDGDLLFHLFGDDYMYIAHQSVVKHGNGESIQTFVQFGDFQLPSHVWWNRRVAIILSHCCAYIGKDPIIITLFSNH